MTSKDNQQYITVEVFNARMDALMAEIRLENEKLYNQIHNEIQGVKTELHDEIQSTKNELHNEIQTTKTEIHNEFQVGFSTLQAESQVNSAKIEMLQHTFYWGFGIMAVVVTLIAYLMRDKDKKEATVEDKNLTKTMQHQETTDNVASKVFSTLGK